MSLYTKNISETVALTASLFKSTVKKVLNTVKIYDQWLWDSLTQTWADYVMTWGELGRMYKFSIGRRAAELLHITEAYNDILNKLLSFTESIIVTDTVKKSISRAIINAISMTQMFTKQPGKSIVNTVTITEIKFFSIVKKILDSVSVTEKVRLYLNGFEQIFQKVIGVTTGWIKRDKATSSIWIPIVIINGLGYSHWSEVTITWQEWIESWDGLTRFEKSATNYTQTTKPSSPWVKVDVAGRI